MEKREYSPFTSISRLLIPVGKMGALLFFLFLAAGLHAQEKWSTKGDQLFQEREYLKAVEMYEWSLRKEETPQTRVKIGDCYRKLNRYREASNWYREAFDAGYNEPDFIVHYGQVLLAQNQFEEVDALIGAGRKAHPRNEKLKEFLIAVGERDYLMTADSGRYDVKKVPINSPASDFSPIFFEDGLVFCSTRKLSPSVVYSSKSDASTLSELYFSQDRGEGKWSKPKRLTGEINSNRSDGPACFTQDGSRAYFTRDENLAKTNALSTKELRKLKIFEAVAGDGGWTQAVPLPFNSDEYAVAHPALSPDEKYLYFSSDMPGGFGGADLYRVTRNGENWGKPENLGSEVNSEGDELFPFLQGRNLYFSSNGHVGLGNLDVFSAIQKGDQWSRVRNLGAPVNSTRDDFGFIIDPAEERGFFSSNRGGTGSNPNNDDIYEFFTLLPEFDCKPQEENNYCWRFFEVSSLSPEELDTLPLVYEWDLGDGTQVRGLEAEHCFEKPGVYEVKLNVIDTTSGFIFMNEASYEMVVEAIKQVYIEAPRLVETQAEITFDARKSNPENCKIERYFWNFGEGMQEGKEVETHTFSQPGKYEISLGVMGIDPMSDEEKVLCATIEVEVMAHTQYEEAIKEDPNAIARERLADIRKLEGVKPSLIENISEKNYSVKDYENASYRVQLIISPVPLTIDSSTFKGMTGVTEFFDDPNYVYTVGNEKDPRKLYRVYRRAVDLEFEAAMIIAMAEDRIISGHDSTFWVKMPYLDQPSLMSVVRGKLRDLNGNPVMADIYFDDLIAGKVFATTTSDQKGDYYIELPNGKKYGFHAEAEGFYPVSDWVDLTGVSTRVEYIGQIKMVSREELVESGTSIRINNIFFETASTELQEESFEELDRLLRILSENPGIPAVIEGHTDNVGNEEYNMELSLNRAKSVLKYLVLKGFNIDKLEAKGCGESKPIAPNSTVKGRAQNRRVEFRFLKTE